MGAGAKVEVAGVGVSHGKTSVLRDVSLTIESGEIVVLVGPSGSGKTTLLSTLNRLVDLEAGTVLIDGADVHRAAPHELRRRVGYCFQALGLFPHLTVAQNVGITPRLLGWPEERIRARVDEMLDLVALPRPFGERLPRELSGGQAQRVAIARALAAEPALLLLDEPFGALDPDTRARLQDEVGAIARRTGTTMVVVSHDLSEAVVLADKLVVLIDGRIAQVGPPREVLARPATSAVAALLDPARQRARQLVALDTAGGSS